MSTPHEALPVAEPAVRVAAPLGYANVYADAPPYARFVRYALLCYAVAGCGRAIVETIQLTGVFGFGGFTDLPAGWTTWISLSARTVMQLGWIVALPMILMRNPMARWPLRITFVMQLVAYGGFEVLLRLVELSTGRSSTLSQGFAMYALASVPVTTVGVIGGLLLTHRPLIEAAFRARR